MNYRKDISERSALRVFERSIHGGLGRGNIGLVMSRAGVGKTAFLVGVGLDDAMRERKVLHVDTEHTAERVRAYYDEVFRDLAETGKLDDRDAIHVKIERNRMIHSFLSRSFNLGRLEEAIGYMQEHIDFAPSCIILDGFPYWEESGAEQLHADLKAIKALAQRTNSEIWLSAQGHREDDRDELGVPVRLQPYLEYLSVLVRLKSENTHVRLQLLKDHDNENLADLHIELDPKTLLLKWE